MTVSVPDQRRPGKPHPPGRRQGPSPLTGECLRPLTRRQIEDRVGELGDLYERISGRAPGAWSRARSTFLRRLALDARRPGFALVIAETVVPSVTLAPGTTVVTGCAYGFPVWGDDPWWRGLDGYLPESLLRIAASGQLFAISELLVENRVRTHDQARDWNLARRLQNRLLTDRAAARGVMLVDRGDVRTLDALQAWGWRYIAADARGTLQCAPCRVLTLR
ncbi:MULTISPECIES: hypothetical protein [unclassified Streptomyces]|uniref:hypothetical protein n=1 Tax=unclassified Streptomyces TaxID=2593676 RepID=UPI003249C11E